MPEELSTYSSDSQRIQELEKALEASESQVDLQREALHDLAVEAEKAGQIQLRLWWGVIILTLLLGAESIFIWSKLGQQFLNGVAR